MENICAMARIMGLYQVIHDFQFFLLHMRRPSPRKERPCPRQFIHQQKMPWITISSTDTMRWYKSKEQDVLCKFRGQLLWEVSQYSLVFSLSQYKAGTSHKQGTKTAALPQPYQEQLAIGSTGEMSTNYVPNKVKSLKNREGCNKYIGSGWYRCDILSEKYGSKNSNWKRN